MLMVEISMSASIKDLAGQAKHLMQHSSDLSLTLLHLSLSLHKKFLPYLIKETICPMMRVMDKFLQHISLQ